MVVDQHDGELDAFLDRRHDLRRHHQPRAVADHHVHLAVGSRHLHAEPAGDLVAHAGVAVLHVVALRVPRAPQLVQIARQAAGGADHHVARARRRVVHRADDLALARAAAVAQRVDARPPSRPTPRCSSTRAAARYGRATGQPASASRELLERRARIADERQRRRACARRSSATLMLMKRTFGILERGLRGGREVAVPGADADDQVGLARDPVRAGRAGHADRAQRAADDRTAARPSPPASRPPGCRSRSTKASSASVASE